MVYYYNQVTNLTEFLAEAKDHDNFKILYQDKGWEGGASHWGRKQLIASRLICLSDRAKLTLLEKHFPKTLDNVHNNIKKLIEGPLEISRLAGLAEIEIVQQYQPDSVGYVWAALAPILRAEAGSMQNIDTSLPQTPERPTRVRYKVKIPDTVPSDSFAIGSSPNRPLSASWESIGSVGYTEAPYAPPVEELPLHLARCFVRCVLNYGQQLDESRRCVQIRDERLHYAYNTEGKNIHAFDDGGAYLFGPSDDASLQVFLLEGKGSFQAIENGKPSVPDNLLAQLVGQALALKRSEKHSSVSPNDIVIINVTMPYCMFFNFHITENYIQNYESLSTADATDGNFIYVEGTRYYDAKHKSDRIQLVGHLLALCDWARTEPSEDMDWTD